MHSSNRTRIFSDMIPNPEIVIALFLGAFLVFKLIFWIIDLLDGE